MQFHVEVPALPVLDAASAILCCLSCSCEFKLQLVPVLALGSVRAVGHEQHLLFLLLVFLLKGCWCRFMWRCLLWQVWMLFLQFYVLLVLFLCI